jgi:hypothetical protein
MLEGISAEADASALSDTDPGTHSIGISGPGKPPFEVGYQIPVRAFETGELPVWEPITTSSGLLSSCHPKKVVWRNCSSSAHSANATSHTSFG